MQLKPLNGIQRRSETGTILVLAAIASFSILAILFFVVNVAHLTKAKGDAQVAVDSAALAGAGSVRNYAATGGDNTKVVALVEAFNGGLGDDSTNTVSGKLPTIDGNADVIYVKMEDGVPIPVSTPSEATGVKVTSDFTVDHFMADVFGFPFSTDVTVSATAIAGGIGCRTPRLPYAIKLREGHSDCPQPPEHCTMDCGDYAKIVFHPDTQETADLFTIGGPPMPAILCRNLVNGVEQHPEMCNGTIIQLNDGVISNCITEMKDQLEDKQDFWTDCLLMGPLDCGDVDGLCCPVDNDCEQLMDPASRECHVNYSTGKLDCCLLSDPGDCCIFGETCGTQTCTMQFNEFGDYTHTTCCIGPDCCTAGPECQALGRPDPDCSLEPWVVDQPIITCEGHAEAEGQGHLARIAGWSRLGIIDVTNSGSNKFIDYRHLCEDLSERGGAYSCGLEGTVPILVE